MPFPVVSHKSLTANNADEEHGILQHMINDPHNPHHHLIYGDWLEEHNRPTEAALHRAIGNSPEMLKEMHEAAHFDDNFDQAYTHVHSPLIRPVTRREVPWGREVHHRDRPATPREASIAARHITQSIGKPYIKPYVQARTAAADASLYGKGYKESPDNSYRAIELHRQAAIHHLRAAKLVEIPRPISGVRLGRLKSDIEYAQERTGLSSPASIEAIHASLRANKTKTLESHQEAVDFHRNAANAHETLASMSHRYAANTHREIANLHRRIIENTDSYPHRRAAYGHVLAAQVHQAYLARRR